MTLLPARWALWQQRRLFVGYALVVEIAALAIAAVSRGDAPSADEWRMFGGLLALGVAQAELSRRVERVRRILAPTAFVNMASVWTFAGVLLLPVPLILLLTAALYLYMALRSWRGIRRVAPFRTVFNASLATLTSLAGRGVLAATGWTGVRAASQHGFTGFAPILWAALVEFVVGAIIVVPGLNITTWTVESVFGTWSDNALELATLGLGAVTAVLLVVMPELSLAVVGVTLLVQRSVVAQELEIAATTDSKTGVYNAQTWRRMAAGEITRAERTRRRIGVLIIDVDRFKLVNDTHGHLVGDLVLQRIASAISDVVRPYDCVGRFGGEEFVALIPDTSHDGVLAVAERVRSAVADLRIELDEVITLNELSVSVGAAVSPHVGGDLDALLQAADGALYAAKDNGRNRIELADLAA